MKAIKSLKCSQCKKTIKKGQKMQNHNIYNVHEKCMTDFIKRHIEAGKKNTIKETKLNDKVRAKKIAWKWFSKYTRLRDANKNGMVKCISCVKTMKALSKECHAGHYIPKSKGEYFYFEEDNVHAQCQQCNMFGSQDTGAEYRVNLINKIGKKSVEELERKAKSRVTLKRTAKDFRSIAETYKELFNKLKEQKDV